MTTPEYSPGLEGVIATETSVSYLDVDIEQILVRGYDLIELAQNLLLYGCGVSGDLRRAAHP